MALVRGLRRRLPACAVLLACAVLGTLFVDTTAASAHERQHLRGCVDGRVRTNLVVKVSADRSTVTVRGRERLCAPVVLIWASYSVPATWDRIRFDRSAVPQHLYDDTRGRLAGAATLRMQVRLPCGNVQIDLYYPPRIKTVGRHGHGRQLVHARLWHRDDCTPHRDRQAIEATIEPGVLTLCTPYPPGRLADLLESSAPVGLAVTDVRSGNQRWTLTVATTGPAVAEASGGLGHTDLTSTRVLVPGARSVTITVY